MQPWGKQTVSVGALVALTVLATFQWLGCAGLDAANKCNADLGTRWAGGACMSAVQDPSNQALVNALADQACARARLTSSDPGVNEASCEAARAKTQKAAWIEIETAAKAGQQPNLTLDSLVPGLPKAPPPALTAIGGSTSFGTSTSSAPPISSAAPNLPDAPVVSNDSPTVSGDAVSSNIIPTGQWAIVIPPELFGESGVDLGQPNMNASRKEWDVLSQNLNERPAKGWPDQQACEQSRVGAAHSSAENFSYESLNELAEEGKADQRLESGHCEQSDGSKLFKVPAL